MRFINWIRSFRMIRCKSCGMVVYRDGFPEHMANWCAGGFR